MKLIVTSQASNWLLFTLFLWVITSNQVVSLAIPPRTRQRTTFINPQRLPQVIASFPRGGSTELNAAPILKDFTADADRYFGSIRCPASFLAGASLGALFIFAAKNRTADRSKSERYVTIIYHLLMMMAYNFSMSTVVVSTAADVTVLHGGFNPMAYSAYELMKREFEFEYVSVRWSFLMSLFSFLGGVTSRAVLEFGLLQAERRRALWFVLLCFISLASHLFSYINQTLYCWPNLVSMTWYYCKVNLAH